MFVPADKLIIEVALDEQTSKAQNPDLPITPTEGAESALAAADPSGGTPEARFAHIAELAADAGRAPARPHPARNSDASPDRPRRGDAAWR